MGGTLLFVHGTGVRQEGLDRTLAAVRDGLGRHALSDARLVAAPWGPEAGIQVGSIALTLPAAPAAKGIGEPVPTDADVTAAMWALLADDPLAQLRLGMQELSPDTGSSFAINRVPPEQAARAMVAGLGPDAIDLKDTGVTGDELRAAAAVVANSPELQGAARAYGTIADQGFVHAAAQAVVAVVLARHRLDEPGTEPAVAVAGNRRDALVDQIAVAIAPPATKGVVKDWLRQRLVGFAERRATSIAVERREGLMTMSSPGFGDILYYQRRGEVIRQVVTNTLHSVQRPVVAVGHSLGGIILVDLLTGQNPPGVDLLFTVGSQSPLFYAIDALATLRPGQTVPVPFTPWVNVYDRHDLLAFRAAEIFSGPGRIVDHEVDSGVPFPPAHSAYWHNDAVYELLQTHWPGDTA